MLETVIVTYENGDVPNRYLDDLPLVDGHCHTVIGDQLDPAAFDRLLTESDRAAPPDRPYSWSPLGLAVRRWCAPVLGLPAGPTVADYLERRTALGPQEATTRLLAAAGLSHLLVDTGVDATGCVSTAELAAGAGAEIHEVVRLESVAERVAARGVTPGDFAEAYVAALEAESRDAVAVKSILAYRHGFDIQPAKPTPSAVEDAARRWLRTPGSRLAHPELLTFVLWCGVERGLPVQVHTGFGDPDIRLTTADPARLQPFLEAVEPLGTPIVLLHCYPYQRAAGWLAAMYPHVYADVGLTLSHVGARAPDVLAEFCELAPFGKVLFSTDAYRLPELYTVGAAQFRWALARVLETWIGAHTVTAADADRIAADIGALNARRLYGL